ncbi:mitochondrial inner membrane protein Mitofilin [Irpex rosettiformis]|uniref:Mitochondrial inner membrane protein Mitofilin n=1 Tax=Irpex rosettiformis TaxID=378272 RepID=A0ACB8U9V4_9APHY|nr:mitochondrial inner membrane protein Mitofilin [Irpex rosettiformis]
MLRAATLAKAPAGRAAVRVCRRRLATEAPQAAPKKKRHPVRRFIIYTTGATATFYVGSAFVAFSNQPYHEFFVENVPLGASFLQYAEDHDWDTLTVQKVIQASTDGIAYVQDLINSEKSEKAIEKTKDVLERTKEASIERIHSVAQTLKTTVRKTEEKVVGEVKKDAVTKHRADQFSEGVEDLVRRAEEALAENVPVPKPGTTTTPEQPEITPPDNAAPAPAPTPAAVTPAKSKGNVYDAPLPVGFEPPPGYAKPAPPKPQTKSQPASAAKDEKATTSPSALAPLPLVAPVVAELGSTEPVISQLASVIDDLASYLNNNPAAADKARDVLESAKGDIKVLADRFDQVKEDERRALEAKLDEQTREYTIKLLELEMEAQDKLDSQEEGFRHFFEEEKAKFTQAYREKLNRELQTQSEIINERLKEEVIAQGIELQRRWIREIKIRVEQERGGRLAKLDELSTNLKRLERIALDNGAYLDENIRVHALWSAIRALTHAVDGVVRKPFRDELRVVRHIAAAREDPVVIAALDTLESSDVPDVGIEPLVDLTSWFTTSVSPRVASVALVPDQNAGLLSHLASYFLSSFSFKRQGLVEGDDVLSVLARAEYYLNEKDLDSATRELNQLRGTARILLTDWLAAARKRLEVSQALEIVQTQATLASLLVSQH